MNLHLFVKTKLPFIISIALLLVALNGHSQNRINSRNTDQKNAGSLMDRLYFGGDFGLGFGTITYVNISPLVGYKINDDLSAGVGIIYQYYKDHGTPSFSTGVYGARLFGKYSLPMIPGLFAMAEYEFLNYDFPFVDPYSFSVYNQKVTANNFYVGGGYSQPIGGRASLDLMILYNLNEPTHSLYSNPVIRMGVNFGL